VAVVVTAENVGRGREPVTPLDGQWTVEPEEEPAIELKDALYQANIERLAPAQIVILRLQLVIRKCVSEALQ
tara:strand:+ start:289 stop:504 length:216 start_codon:yes stop_codon:yes gene_type:complete